MPAAGTRAHDAVMIEKNRRRWLLSLVLAAVAVTVTASSGTADAARSATAPPALQHLDSAGGDAAIVQDIPINVVFVGLDEGDGATEVNVEWFLANQPAVSRQSEHRARAAGEDGAGDLGIEYRFQYLPIFTDEAFEDSLFGFMAASAYGPFAATPVQAAYSSHPRAAEAITENHVLDATEVESWLIEHGRSMLGIDTMRPTVFFLNWYGRDDFRFHTYAPFTYQPETDVFAPEWLRNHTIAWGGGTPDAAQIPTSSLGRVWFMDVSAGPDLGTMNWLLDVGDLDGDGLAEARIPPIWEYPTEHWFRPFDFIGGDLSAVLRYTAIDLLFAPGPLFDAGISAPLLDDALELDINVFDKVPDGNLGGLNVDEVVRRLQALDPSRRFTADVETNPFTPALDRAYRCASTPGLPDPRFCHPGDQNHNDGPLRHRNPLDLLIWATHHESQYLDGQRGEIPVALFDVDTTERVPYLGVSYDQRWNFVWDTTYTRQRRYSPTHTMAHEVGHHLGVRHPHDGYDPERDQTFGVTADFFAFASLGDESATTMSYLGSQIDFSQFDRDNLDRWLMAARFDAANEILADIYASPRASASAEELRRADELAGTARARLASWDLRGASLASRDAYQAVLAAASASGVQVEPHAAEADIRSEGPWWATDAIDDDHHQRSSSFSGGFADARVEGVGRDERP
jgi:hypothetical protein